jgi:hypothetical protein
VRAVALALSELVGIVGDGQGLPAASRLSHTDRGISAGMREGIEAAARAVLRIECRSIYQQPVAH